MVPYRDIALVAAAFALCPLVAVVAPDSAAEPLARARAIVALERELHLYFEPDVQRWLAGRPALLSVVSFIYMWAHVPATVGALVWTWLERRRAFALVRDTFLATQAVVVAGYLLAPTAPPRMLSGEVETGGIAHTVQSPYAAMPSGHVAFAVVVAGILATQARPLRFAAPLYPLLVTATVIATANHFWLDALAGVAAAMAGCAIAVNRFVRVARTAEHARRHPCAPPRRPRPATGA